jgi:hypothetical protein
VVLKFKRGTGLIALWYDKYDIGNSKFMGVFHSMAGVFPTTISVVVFGYCCK